MIRLSFENEILTACRQDRKHQVRMLENLLKHRKVTEKDIQNLDLALEHMCELRMRMVREKDVNIGMLRELNFEVSALSLASGLIEMKFFERKNARTPDEGEASNAI